MNLTSKLGESEVFRIPLRRKNAPFLPGTNYALTFTVKASPSDADADSLLQKATGGLGIEIEGDDALITILRADTYRDADYPNPGDPAFEATPDNYYWDIQADGLPDTEAEGNSFTVASGIWALRRDITRAAGPTMDIIVVEDPIVTTTGKSAYQSYLDTTTDDPPLSEAEWSNHPEDPNLVSVASPTNGDMIQRVGGSWVTRTLAQIKTALGLGSAAYTESSAYAPASGISPSAISGTAVVDNDSRLTNARTPTSHASSHATGGSDPITPANIGALQASSNLSDLSSASTARTNLGLGTAATANTGDAEGNVPTIQAGGLLKPTIIPDPDVGAIIHAATSLITPVDADEMGVANSQVVGYPLSRITWANIKATLKTYFDGLYPSGSGSSSGTNTGDETATTIKSKLGISTLSGSNTGDQDLSGLVPYTGGTSNVNLGAHNLTVDTDTLFVDATNNRVGIGTASPETPLHVVSYGNVSLVVNSSSGQDSQFQFRTANTVAVLMGYGNGGMRIYDNIKGESLIYSPINTGRVGIGTESPSTKLHVNGTLTVGSGTWDGSNITGAQTFTSTTRPTSSATGSPSSTSLMTRDDCDGRYLQRLATYSTTNQDSTTTTFADTPLTASLSTGFWRISVIAMFRNPSGTDQGGLIRINISSGSVSCRTVHSSRGKSNEAWLAFASDSASGFRSSDGLASADDGFGVKIEGLIEVTSAATLTIQMAQGTASANTTRLVAGASMICEKLP